MLNKVQLAIAGLGLIGRRHADCIRSMTSIELAAVVDPSDEARKYAEKYEIAWYESLQGMLHERRPDGVVLATPNMMHVEQGMQCIDSKVPVLIEKPLATSAAEALPLVEAAEASGVPVMVGHHRRFNPIIQAASEAIRAGLIGSVRTVHSTSWFYKPDYYFDSNPWRKESGAGPIAVNLVHDIDLMRYLCGEISGIQAQKSDAVRGYANEDTAAALISFANGAIGTITVSDAVTSPWSWELTANENPAYPPTKENCYMIGGSHGALSIPDLKIWNYEGEPDWWKPIRATALLRGNKDPFFNQLLHFAEVIKGRTSPLVSSREGYKTLLVLEAMQMATETGGVIRINGG